MHEIADRVGMNKALLHYHFRSKAEGLLVYAAVIGFAPIILAALAS